MTTEHQTAPDFPERRQPDDVGSGKKADDGALDPSVFFGLFDDLDESEGRQGTNGADSPSDEQVGEPHNTTDSTADVETVASPEQQPDSERGELPEQAMPEQVAGADQTIVADDPTQPGQPVDTDTASGTDMNLDDAIGLVLGTGPDNGESVDADKPTSDIDRHIVSPNGDGLPFSPTDDIGSPGETSSPEAPNQPESVPDRYFPGFGFMGGETTVEAGGPDGRPDSSVPSPPELPPQTGLNQPQAQVDSGYESHEPPTPVADYVPAAFETPQHESPSIVLGGDPGEITTGSYPVDVGTSNVDTFQPHSDLYSPSQDQSDQQHPSAHQFHDSQDQDSGRRQDRATSRSEDSSLTVTAVVMTIAASFAIGLIGLAAMFALTDGDDDGASTSQDASVEEVPTTTDQDTTVDAADPEPAQTEATPADTIDVNGDADIDGQSVNPLLDPVGAMIAATADGRIDLLALEFAPGTENLTAESAALVEALAPQMAELAAPILMTIRATGEPTAQANLDLSRRRGDALISAFVAAGVPETQVRATGLGSGPLSGALPVPDFVAATPELGDAVFSESVAASGPFTIGSRFDDSASFRVEAVTAAARLRQAMDRFTDSTIGLAAYSFFAPDNESARAAASQLASTVVAELTSDSVDAERITVITPGAAPYVITPELGGHVWLQAGSEAILAFEVAGLDTAAITFEPGSSTLTADGQATLDQLALLLNSETGSLTVAVRSYGEASPEQNTTLSQQQAAEITRYLSEVGGVEQARLRDFGTGPSTYYPNDGGTTVTLTVGP